MFLCPVVRYMNFSSDGIESFRKKIQTHRLLNDNVWLFGFFNSCFVSSREVVHRTSGMGGSQAKKQSLLLSNPPHNWALDAKVKSEEAQGWKPATTNHIH